MTLSNGTNTVTFNVIPDIGSITAQLSNIPAIPALLLVDLNTWVLLEQAQVDNLSAQLSTDNTTIANLNAQVSNQQATITQQANQISLLPAQLAAAKAATASPLDVAQSFKSVVDTIQQNAILAGGMQTTLTKDDVVQLTMVS